MIELDPDAFTPYGKTARVGKASMTVTEKIDGTNAFLAVREGKLVCCGSRNRVIIPGADNAGFAGWAYDNAAVLAEFLGDGDHYGEWAGPGIQRNPLRLREKTLFLFNVQRFPIERFEHVEHPDNLTTVPVLGELYQPLCLATAEGLMEDVALRGTQVAYRRREEGTTPLAEGIIISTLGTKMKLTPDARPKGARP